MVERIKVRAGDQYIIHKAFKVIIPGDTLLAKEKYHVKPQHFACGFDVLTGNTHQFR